MFQRVPRGSAAPAQPTAFSARKKSYLNRRAMFAKVQWFILVKLAVGTSWLYIGISLSI